MFISLRRRYIILHRRGVIFSAAVAVALVAAAWFWLSAVAPYQEHFTLYFSSNIHGLSVGAPVKMNGQDIGNVDKIEIVSVPAGDAGKKYFAAVSVTLDTKVLTDFGRLRRGQTFGDALPRLIDIGLRGKLIMPSMLSNGLCVNLYFNPGQPATSVNPPNAKYPEIPTNYTSTSDFVDRANAFIETRNLYEISKKIRGLQSLISDFDAKTANLDCAALNAQTLALLEKATAAIDADAAHQQLAALNADLREMCLALERNEKISRERQEALSRSLKEFSKTLRETREAAQMIREQLSPESVESRRRFLRELGDRFAPLIQFCKELVL